MELDSGTIAWMLTSTALVLLMTPGLALFYGGQARSKSVLNMMMMVFSTTATVGVLWVIFGYSMSFGDDVGGGLLGNPGQYFMLSSLLSETVQTDGLPDIAFVAFQAMFAILTVGLIAGAAADRMKFNSWMVFSILWATIVYFPIAHWVFDLDAGWIANGIGAVDFAGGTAVHINAGTAALVLCIVLGRRRGWPREAMRPHNLTMVMLGAGLLWFGWFGFNAGSAAVANYSAAYAFLNTVVATCTAICGWLIIEQIRDGKATSLGAASGIVAGLVAITPACAAVTPLGAMAIGFIAGVGCAYAVGLKYKLGFDDSFDVVGRPPRRWSDRHAAHRLLRLGRRAVRGVRRLLRRRLRPAGHPGHRRGRRDRLLGHRHRDHRPDHQGGHGPARRGRQRGHGRRRGRARRVGLRLLEPAQRWQLRVVALHTVRPDAGHRDCR